MCLGKPVGTSAAPAPLGKGNVSGAGQPSPKIPPVAGVPATPEAALEERMIAQRRAAESANKGAAQPAPDGGPPIAPGGNKDFQPHNPIVGPAPAEGDAFKQAIGQALNEKTFAKRGAKKAAAARGDLMFDDKGTQGGNGRVVG